MAPKRKAATRQAAKRSKGKAVAGAVDEAVALKEASYVADASIDEISAPSDDKLVEKVDLEVTERPVDEKANDSVVENVKLANAPIGADRAVALYSESSLPKRVAGPANPYSDKPLILAEWKNHPLGRVEPVVGLSNEEFEAQRRAFDRQMVEKRIRHGQGEVNKPLLGPRLPKGEASDVHGFRGPWAGYEGEKADVLSGPREEEVHAHLAKKEAAAPVAVPVESLIRMGEEKSVFHGAQEKDYMGRTFMHVPLDLDIRLDKEPGSFECFVPKKLIHTWVGHTKGVTAIRFFPQAGHLLLSGSQDCRVKIWDVHRDRKCQRTYLGHNKPVKDICFDHTGRAFVSASYDQSLKHWDTETGRCLWGLAHSAIPFCVKIHPELPHILLAGCSDRRVLQWDLRSGEMVQEYAQHQEAVNTITFIDGNRRFVTTSDDKTVRVWDYDLPVTVKYVAEPDMHSMPAAALHPSGSQMLFQSLNNQVITYACGEERFQQRGRKFGGHTTSGYACNVGFSPDGKYLISGDGRGHLVCWDWATGQVAKRIEAHTKVCIDVQWNPQEASRVATCSWDGTIKYWD
jgi:pre-mRNA-processing factor 17